ncbi:MAG: DUF2029 domain-containing protein, partial [Deltaproteobacteria bacterium]|nr:DUF2029 domain-containing protein [Deltaproteobacteria bacterium]
MMRPVLQWLVGLNVIICLLLFGAVLVSQWGPALISGQPAASPQDDPVGADYAPFHSAASLALAGKAGEAYHPKALQGEIKRLTGGESGAVWPYPPIFLLMLLPLGFLSYLPSLLLWLGVSLCAFVGVLRRLVPHVCTVWLALAFPGTFLNLLNGQNGLLSAALMGAGLVLLERRPGWAGAVLGLMSYKPHLAPLIPLALAAGGQRRALAGAGATLLGLILITSLSLGWELWADFFTGLSKIVGALEHGSFPRDKQASLLAAVRLAGGGPALAWTLQGAVMLLAVLAVVWAWRRPMPHNRRAAVLVLATLLFSPHLFYYDLALLALPLAWLGQEALEKKPAPLFWLLALIAWYVPLMTYPFRQFLGPVP